MPKGFIQRQWNSIKPPPIKYSHYPNLYPDLEECFGAKKLDHLLICTGYLLKEKTITEATALQQIYRALSSMDSPNTLYSVGIVTGDDPVFHIGSAIHSQFKGGLNIPLDPKKIAHHGINVDLGISTTKTVLLFSATEKIDVLS